MDSNLIAAWHQYGTGILVSWLALAFAMALVLAKTDMESPKLTKLYDRVAYTLTIPAVGWLLGAFCLFLFSH